MQVDLDRLLVDAEMRLKWLRTENENIDSADKASSDSSDSPSVSSPKNKLAGCKRGPGRPQVNDRIKNIKLSNRLFSNSKSKVKKTEVSSELLDKSIKNRNRIRLKP